MTENDKELMNILMKEKEKCIVSVDNDDVSVYLKDDDELIGTFDKFGYNLLNDLFNYLGIPSEMV